MISASLYGGDHILVDGVEPYYTNEDVAILHDIVAEAERLLPSLPERERVPTNALFHAYYTILPSIGIDTNHDSRYARVLFKIGGMRSVGTLYDKFEAVLARMGIEIQFDLESNSKDSDTTTELRTVPDDIPSLKLKLSQSLAEDERPTSRRRRNSESSVWHFSPGSAIKPTRRHRSYSSSSKPGHLDEDLSKYATKQTSNSYFSRVSDHRIGGEKIGAWLTDSSDPDPSKARRRSASSHNNSRLRRKLTHPSEHDTGIASTFTNSDGSRAVESSSHLDQNITKTIEASYAYDAVPHRSLYVSQTLLNNKANLTGRQRNHSHLRSIWRQWYQNAMQLQADNSNLALLASHRDKQILLRQALDTWRSHLRNRYMQAETERFFSHLERRATRARDVFLLAKSFTHWAQSASDEIRQTSVARRYILRTRYFKAWRENTAVNELKVRRQVIKKFFLIWNRQYLLNSEVSKSVVAIYESDVVQKTFWKWFWTFCGRRAPAWRATRLKRANFTIWRTTTKTSNGREDGAILYRDNQLRQKGYIAWVEEIQEQDRLRDAANLLLAHFLLSKTLVKWRMESRLVSPAHRLKAIGALRLKRDTLRTMYLRAQQNRSAESIDQKKILREAWVVWNDKTRSKAIQSRVSDRLIIHALYKWVVTERMVLARRITDRKMIEKVLQVMAKKCQFSIGQTLKDFRTAKEFASHKLQKRTFANWRFTLQRWQLREQISLQFIISKFQAHVMERWAIQAAHIIQLQIWARDAEFYFVTNRVLELWKGAAETAKRERRRRIYATVRKKHKMSLVSRNLSIWRRKTMTIVDLNMRGVTAYNSHSLVHGMEVFDRWRALAEEITELGSSYQKRRQRKFLSKWKIRSVVVRRLGLDAIYSLEERIFTSVLRKWTLVTMQMRVCGHLVSELRDKHSKKICRKIMLHWYERTSQGRQTRQIAQENIAVTGNFARLPRTERAGTWSERGDDLDIDEWGHGLGATDISTPLPGYLATPSRRTARGRQSTRLFSTTPSAPLPVAFERLLRAEYSDSSLQVNRRL